MARVQYGSLVTNLKGKIGGHVFQRCGQSGSLRSKSTVVSSQSSYSQATRNQFSSLASEWRSLTTSQRNSFSIQASTYPTFDSYGNPIVLTGYQLFMYINRTVLMAGYPIVTTCVPYAAPPIVPGYVASLDPDFPEWIIELDGYVTNPVVCLIYASQWYTPPRLITSPKMIYVNKITQADGGAQEIYPEYVARYGSTFNLGWIVYLEYWFLNTTTGCAILGNTDYYEYT